MAGLTIRTGVAVRRNPLGQVRLQVEGALDGTVHRLGDLHPVCLTADAAPDTQDVDGVTVVGGPNIGRHHIDAVQRKRAGYQREQPGPVGGDERHDALFDRVDRKHKPPRRAGLGQHCFAARPKWRHRLRRPPTGEHSFGPGNQLVTQTRLPAAPRGWAGSQAVSFSKCT